MCNEKCEIYLVGIGMGNPDALTAEARKAFMEADVILGAKRMTDALKALGRPAFCAYRGEEILAFLNGQMQYRKVAVALSGDPGFYSGCLLYTSRCV